MLDEKLNIKNKIDGINLKNIERTNNDIDDAKKVWEDSFKHSSPYEDKNFDLKRTSKGKNNFAHDFYKISNKDIK
ncbi:hypothetical protein [Tepiditoga spiralis]|uniref:hypothetical protein n=1 Tax=Tepiditoga spiralis TaxID=2108365 RepID=UPI0016824442|nr:hypothetical protein [Tepiditoga spiralis]